MNVSFVEKVISDVDEINSKYDYLKLIILWTIVEAWTVEKNETKNKRTKRDAINWLRTTRNDFLKCADNFWKVANPEGLTECAERINLQIIFPDKSNKKYFADPNNKADIIELIYQIRNCIIHGKWQIGWENNSQEKSNIENTILSAAKFLEKWVRQANSDKVFG